MAVDEAGGVGGKEDRRADQFLDQAPAAGRRALGEPGGELRVGDEGVQDIVRPADAGTACVGCHASTPDGAFVGFSASPQAGNGDPATFGLRTVDGNATGDDRVSFAILRPRLLEPHPIEHGAADEFF